jgi:hypothetical protein
MRLNRAILAVAASRYWNVHMALAVGLGERRLAARDVAAVS